MEQPSATDPARRPGAHPEIAALQDVMRQLDDLLPDILVQLLPSHRALLPNALLNLAVNHILVEEGAPATAAMLQRLAALVGAGDSPSGGEGYLLNGADA